MRLLDRSSPRAESVKLAMGWKVLTAGGGGIKTPNLADIFVNSPHEGHNPSLWGLSKYQTAQDTQLSPTPSKHNRTLSSHSSLLSLQSRSIILIINAFFLSWVLGKFIQRPFFPFLHANAIAQLLEIQWSFICCDEIYTGAFCANSARICYLKSPL